MTLNEVCKIGKVFRLCKITLPGGAVFIIFSRRNETSDDWEPAESTCDAGLLAGRIVKWGLAKDFDAALKLLHQAPKKGR